MRRPRIFLPGARPGLALPAGAAAFHHLARVLRRGPGDALIVLDGLGGIFEGRIAAVDASAQELAVEIGQPFGEETPRIAPLAAAVAIPRGDGLELAIRLASETGLERLLPLITARTVARPRDGSRKAERWRRIARESAEQCRRALPLEVEDPVSWGAFLGALRAEGGRGWVALPGGPPPGEAGLLAALAAAGEPAGPAGPRIAVAIGPEGGFSGEEVREAIESGLAPLGFPVPVLRTPTAVVYLGALAALAATEAPPEIRG